MGRSVSTPSNCVYVSYATFECEDAEFASDDFEYYRDDFADQMCKAFPSVSKCDEWLDREDHAVAENQFAYFGVSEYRGLVAMWVAAKDADYRDGAGWEALRDNWLSMIQQKFRKHAQTCFGQALYSVGRASNGEQFFQPMNGQQQGSLGLGFTSKEGWL